jgi:hypothetical protein
MERCERRKSSDKSATTIGKKYVPTLPVPKNSNTSAGMKKINFLMPLGKIKIVSEYLFEDPDRDPSDVGLECFESVLKEAEETEK